jgi:hypothetical protein
VEHDHHLVGNAQSESLRQFGIENILTLSYLDFEKMISGAQCADLPVAALYRFPAYLGGVRSAYSAELFRALQVLIPAVSILDTPLGAIFDQGPELVL